MRSIHDLDRQVWLVHDEVGDGAYRTLVVAGEPLADALPDGAEEVGEAVYRLTCGKTALRRLRDRLRDAGREVRLIDQGGIIRWAGRLADEGSGTRLGLDDAARHVPDGRCHVNLLGNGAPVMLCRAPAPIEVLNDTKGIVANFFRVLRDPEGFLRLFMLSRLLPRIDEERERGLRSLLAVGQQNATVSAWTFFRLAASLIRGYCGRIRGARLFNLRPPLEVFNRRGPAERLYELFDRVDGMLGTVHGRLYRVQLERYSLDKIVDIYDGPETVFWADAPDEGDQVLGVIKALEAAEGAAAVHQSNYADAAQIRNDLCPGWRDVLLEGGAGLLVKPAGRME